MQTLAQIVPLRAQLRQWRDQGARIALVPTMGNLHAGHTALVALARKHAERVVASIFINPTQFGPAEDYAAYPRTPETDARQLAAAGLDLLFMPTVSEMYPGGSEEATRVTVPGLSTILCGAARPGHFAGVTSVCCRLFNIVQPQVAVFGQKDYQQLVILRRMVADLHLPVSIVAGATVRDPDGLALSSRNQYLDDDQRARAPALYRALAACRGELLAGRSDFPALQAQGEAALRAAGFVPDYFAIRNARDLSPATPGHPDLVILAAGTLGRARLIDNLLLQDT